MSGKLPAVPKSRTVELRLLDIDGEPLRRADVGLAMGADFFESSRTNDGGFVIFEGVPLKPDEGELTVTPKLDKGLKVTFTVFLAKYGDATTGPGMKARLNNLGFLFLDGPPDQALGGPLDAGFNRALARFRHANHFTLDTAVASVTERLTDAHDTTTGPLTK